MRSSFGRFVQELRLKRRMTQKEFSELSGMSLAHVSNLEHQRMNINDKMLGVYIKVLDCTGAEALELRKRANFSNSIRKSDEPSSPNTPIRVMFEEFGERISPKAREEIQKILERETGETLDALRFSSNRTPSKSNTRSKQSRRPVLSPQRFAEIALLAEEHRRRICGETEKLDIGLALERLSHLHPRLDYDVVEELPQQLEGAFAAIVGHSDGHTIMVEERRFASALNGVHFARHVVAHELGHHFLHPELLASNKDLWLPPQALAQNTPEGYGSDRRIEQVVNTRIEVEAECFATLFLVPWTAFLKGTSVHYLADDYGEQKDEVKRYAAFFTVESAKDAFREALWKKGIRRHPIFEF